MFSKAQELAGITLIGFGIASLEGTAAGIIFGGIALLFLGSVTDDSAVGAHAKRGFAWCRYAYRRRVLKEQLITEQASEWSPHPPIHVDPETQRWSERMAKSRLEREKSWRDGNRAVRSEEELDALEQLA